MAMSSYTTVLNDVRVDTDAPKTYLTVKYAYERDGANMKYKIYCYARIPKGSYRNDSCGLQIKLDNSEKFYDTSWKPSGNSNWPAGPLEQIYTINNKTSGTTSLYVRFWDSQGSVGDLNYSHTWNMTVAPAGPILLLGSITQYINHLKVNLSNTITGNMTKYELARVSDGVVVKTGDLSSVTSFQVDITGLNTNTSYNGTYKIRAYANDCWGDWLTLSDTNLKTKSLPTASISSTSLSLSSSLTVGISSTDDISSFQYEIKTNSGTSDVSVKTETGITTATKSISLSNSEKTTILNKYTNTPDANCKIITKVISNGTTYTLNENTFKYTIPSANYKPTFDSSYITNVRNTGYSTIMGTNTNKYIKNHNTLQGTIIPMVANGGASGKNYTLSCGTKNTSLNYSSSNQNFTLNNIDGNTLSVIASDTRTFTNNGSKALTLIDYANPKNTSINIIREGGVGTTAKITASGTYTNWSGLAQNNQIISVKYKWKEVGGTETEVNITSLLTVNTNGQWTVSGNLPTTFAASKKYDITLIFSDRLETVTLTAYRLSTAEVLVWRDLANKRIGINKKPDYALDVDGDIRGTNIRSTSNIYPSGRVQKDTAGNWIGDRDRTPLRNNNNGNSGGYASVISQKTKDGNWTIGAYQDNSLIFNYTNDTDYNNNNNNALQWRLPPRGTSYSSSSNLALLAYPVGSIYLTMNSTSPATLFGGTWVRIGVGRTLISAGGGTNPTWDSNTDSWGSYTGEGKTQWFGVGELGGETGHVLNTNEIPAHTHGSKTLEGTWKNNQARWPGTSSVTGMFSNIKASQAGYWSKTGGTDNNTVGFKVTATHEHNSVGLGYEHNNMQPYIAVYMWKRTG